MAVDRDVAKKDKEALNGAKVYYYSPRFVACVRTICYAVAVNWITLGKMKKETEIVIEFPALLLGGRGFLDNFMTTQSIYFVFLTF